MDKINIQLKVALVIFAITVVVVIVSMSWLTALYLIQRISSRRSDETAEFEVEEEEPERP